MRDQKVEDLDDSSRRNEIADICDLGSITKSTTVEINDDFELDDQYKFFTHTENRRTIKRKCIEMRRDYQTAIKSIPASNTSTSTSTNGEVTIKEEYIPFDKLKTEARNRAISNNQGRAFNALIKASAEKKLREDVEREFGEQKELPLCAAIIDRRGDDPFGRRRDDDDDEGLMGQGRGTVR